MNDINHMDIGEMIDLMITQQNMIDEIKAEKDSDTRKATQADIDAFFG